jgi:hypothetical protein
MAVLALSPRVIQPEAAGAAERVGGEFALERLDLRFVGGQKVRILAAGQDVRAEVEITFAGTGQLGGAWEIAEATTTAGSPQFRTLELVSRLLGMGRHEVITSPPLPTTAIGAYLVRLRITSPEIVGSPLVLRYFVGQSAGEAVSVQTRGPGTIEARGPAAGSPADDLKFSWQPVAASIAYQLEIHEKEGAGAAQTADGEEHHVFGLIRHSSSLDRAPATGIIVPGSQTEVTLSPVAARRLAAGRTYLWRVVALDQDGKVLCDSPLQELVR